jgi:ubiquinone/menaquinone biosynthesis C-methylase UbiE
MSYKAMASYLKFRERFRKPKEFLEQLDISQGEVVLDHGCGIGSYSIPAAELVGPSGMVYALDIHPLAIERTEKRAQKDRIENLKTILSGLENGLPDGHVDTVLLIDVFKSIEDKPALLREFHRVLKPSGRLFILIDHVSPEECKSVVSKTNLFDLVTQKDNLLHYIRRQ